MTTSIPIPASIQGVLGLLLLVSSLGVLVLPKPVHASLSFLVSLLMLAVFYLELSAQFIAVMQVLVYAGAILVIFMFVIILFQDAHEQIAKYEAKSAPFILCIAGALFYCPFCILENNSKTLFLQGRSCQKNLALWKR